MRQPQHVALSTPTLIIKLLRTLYLFRPAFWPKEPQKLNPDITVASAAGANDRVNATSKYYGRQVFAAQRPTTKWLEYGNPHIAAVPLIERVDRPLGRVRSRWFHPSVMGPFAGSCERQLSGRGQMLSLQNRLFRLFEFRSCRFVEVRTDV